MPILYVHGVNTRSRACPRINGLNRQEIAVTPEDRKISLTLARLAGWVPNRMGRGRCSQSIGVAGRHLGASHEAAATSVHVALRYGPTLG
jgi:hypothetical protein